MKIFILGIWEKLRQWTLKWAHSPHMAGGLFVIAFVESSFFPIPPDVLMIAILMINAERWWFYAAITAIGSVLGAILGYVIGYALYATIGQYIVDAYNLQATVDAIGLKYSQHTFLTVFTAAFTPIPFKIITISAGLFKVPIISFIVASIVGRAARFFLVAYIIKVFGPRVTSFIYKYFNIFSILVVALIIIAIVVINFLF